MKTIAPITVASSEAGLPEFTDSKGLKLFFGLGRSQAYQLAAEGKIKAVSLREEGKTRGRRLWVCSSVRAFLNSRLLQPGAAK